MRALAPGGVAARAAPPGVGRRPESARGGAPAPPSTSGRSFGSLGAFGVRGAPPRQPAPLRSSGRPSTCAAAAAGALGSALASLSLGGRGRGRPGRAGSEPTGVPQRHTPLGAPRDVSARSFLADPVALAMGAWGDGGTGGEGEAAELHVRVAGKKTGKGLVHRYVVAVRRAMRAGTASTKTRGEVRGGGRKPYQQKGTGRARRGSTRSPLIRGGGAAFGPKPRDWSIRMNKRERRLALSTALYSAHGDTVVVPSADLPGPRTRELVGRLAHLGLDMRKDKVLLLVASASDDLRLASRNLGNLTLNTIQNLHVYDLLAADRVVLDRPALVRINAAFGPDGDGVLARPGERGGGDTGAGVGGGSSDSELEENSQGWGDGPWDDEAGAEASDEAGEGRNEDDDDDDDEDEDEDDDEDDDEDGSNDEDDDEDGSNGEDDDSGGGESEREGVMGMGSRGT